MAELPKTCDHLDPKLIKRFEPLFETLYRHYFRCEVEGFENAPAGQAVYVGNHNGILTFEVLMLFHAWWKQFGTQKRVLGLAHKIAFESRFFRWMVPKLGTIPADREGAYRALKDGYSVMVYPGGEREALRPSRDRKKVDFYGRKGFIKLALRAGVPIVPIVSIGAHETYMIFARGERLARALGFRKAFRLHGMPITLRSLFFLWSIVGGVLSLAPLALIPASFFSIFVPLPAKMTFKILPALDPRTLWNDALSEEVNIDFIYEHILQNMQEIASKAYADRRFPVLG